ncbi:MAG: helix-turn-helix transcriptional regulator [Saprospiraceae bacterium]|nr:helix-turn-helix transcriptional regulator [Saprospiraceae bacterium]
MGIKDQSPEILFLVRTRNDDNIWRQKVDQKRLISHNLNLFSNNYQIISTMFTKEELLEDPEYLLARYQNEIYYQLDTFMSKNNFTQSEIASKLGVSSSYVSQVLNGNFNFTLKKLIEIGLMMDKVPSIEFLDPIEFWTNQSKSWINSFSPKWTSYQQLLLVQILKAINQCQ